MKISIVTISYNQAPYLKQCLDSVFGQCYPDVEYIVVDPGSTDGSRELIESYGDKIIRIFEPDHGPADGLNKGFLRATGDVFYFLNSDDYLLPGAFEAIADEFAANPGLELVCAAGWQVDAKGVKQKSFYPSKASTHSYVYGAVTLFQQGMFFSCGLFRKVRGFNGDNKTSWDGELFLDFLKTGTSFKRVMTPVAAFRIYPESITGSQRFSDQFMLDSKRMFCSVYGPNASKLSVLSIYYRMKKLLLDPVYVLRKLFG